MVRGHNLRLTSPQEWANGVAFTVRYDDDFAALRAEGVTVRNGTDELLNEVVNIVLDISNCGGFGREWGGDTPKNYEARLAVARILLRAGAEIEFQVRAETSPSSPSRLDKEGKPTEAHFEKCRDALFDVSEFAGRVLEGTYMDCFAETEDVLGIRRAFALAPDALAAVTWFFDEGLARKTEWAKEHYEASVGPLPPEAEESESEPEEKADEMHVFADWVIRQHVRTKAEFDRLNDCLLASKGQSLCDFLESDSPLVADLRKRFKEEANLEE